MKAIALIGLCLVSAVCQAVPPAAETPAVWIDVPFVQQVRDGCGSASISMVLQYWERHGAPTLPEAAAPARIQAALYSPADRGIFAGDMQEYFRQAGYQTFAFTGEWADLQHHLEQGRPLIVSLKESGARGPLHYVVVVGIDAARGYLFLNDPAQRKMLRVSRQGFESQWSPAHHWALLAVPQIGDRARAAAAH